MWATNARLLRHDSRTTGACTPQGGVPTLRELQRAGLSSLSSVACRLASQRGGRLSVPLAVMRSIPAGTERSYRAKGPRRRTDADREHRRKHKAQSWDGLRRDVPLTVIEALLHARPQLREVDPNVVQGLAHIISIAASRARRHAEHEDWFSLNSIELEGRFGRGKFNLLNDRYYLFDVNASYEAQKTRAYRVRPDVRQIVDSRIDDFIRTPRAVTKLMGPDGKKRRRVPAYGQRRATCRDFRLT